ncbi:MAG: arginine--tRNA ligase [Candidatus Sumerlaeota bacterium]|nr:arginine--tRNA ligase [Candidatus Sumerlaeota bacterium]
MPNVLEILKARAREAIEKKFGAIEMISLTPATDPKFGHYQCNAAMALAHARGMKPRDAATQIVEALDVADLCLAPEIAGPGFINLTLKPEWLTDQLRGWLHDERLGVAPDEPVQRVVIDFSSPNIAKELHVGHLRSTIIGACLARFHEFLGHTVLRRNHVGDWGTQFGMLIAHLKDRCPQALTEESEVDLGDIVAFYKEAKKRFDEDEEFKQRARSEVVKLQSGDLEATRGWKVLCDQSRRQFDEIYRLLDVSLEEKGESFYNPYIPATLHELQRLGLIVESEGAWCVFPDPEKFQSKEGSPLPLIVRKQDGGFNYDTTDMTAIRYRVREERADKIIYVTDAGQAQHFAMVFAAARKAGWLEGVEVVHVPFGMVLGEDKKKLKTRSGETVRLKDLLDEAVARARVIVDEKNPDLSEEQKAEVARVIGIGAVKYADLSQNRISDYVFSFDKMLALQGNTAPYMIYAYVRVQSIARKGGIDFASLDPAAIQTLETPEEIDLGRLLLRLPEVIDSVERELAANRMSDYLFDLAQNFSRFYTNNRVLGDPRETTRLALCSLTARALRIGLWLLGIGVIEEM